MATSALLSTLVTGAALLVILAAVIRLRHWQHPTPGGAAEGASDLVRSMNGPFGWSVAFFLVAFCLTVLSIAYASGETVAGLTPETLGVLVAAVLGGVVVIALVVAVYAAVRSRGLNSAQAAGVSSALMGTIVLLAIVAQLLIGG